MTQERFLFIFVFFDAFQKYVYPPMVFKREHEMQSLLQGDASCQYGHVPFVTSDTC